MAISSCHHEKVIAYLLGLGVWHKPLWEKFTTNEIFKNYNVMIKSMIIVFVYYVFTDYWKYVSNSTNINQADFIRSKIPSWKESSVTEKLISINTSTSTLRCTLLPWNTLQSYHGNYTVYTVYCIVTMVHTA